MRLATGSDRHTETETHGDAAPTPAPPPTGPFAVVVTNSARAGTTYDVLVIDLTGRIVARATANLPLLKQNQTVEPALVSASSSTVYYLNGDTDIWSLSVAGHSTLAKSIAAGAMSSLGFAVSPDDTRIAVAAMKQTPNATGSTGQGWAEDLHDAGSHVDLWSNTDQAALRWPVGWHGATLIDQIETGNGYGCQYGGDACSKPGSYHVVDVGGGSNTVAVCETPTTPLPDGNRNEIPTGLPTAAGTACTESGYTYSTRVQENEIYAVDWTGAERTFADVKSTDGGAPLTVNACFLAPDGTRMACADNSSQALTLLAPDGKTRNLGRRYNILGWVDPTHLLVDIDSSTLAVLNVDSATESRVPLAQADKVTMVSALPGAL